MRPLPVLRAARFPAFSSGVGAAEAALRPAIPGRLSRREGRGSAGGSVKGSERLCTSPGEGFGRSSVLSACGGCEVPCLPAAGGSPPCEEAVAVMGAAGGGETGEEADAGQRQRDERCLGGE